MRLLTGQSSESGYLARNQKDLASGAFCGSESALNSVSGYPRLMRSPDQSAHQNNALNTAAASSAAGIGTQNYPADTTRVVDTRITRTDGYYTADEDTTLLQPTRTLGHTAAPTKAELQAAPEPPFAAGLRRFLTVVLCTLALVTGLGATTGAWVNSKLMSERGFSQISSNLAEDPELASRIADGAVEDLMNSEAMTTFLDGTKESGLYSILVKPTQDGIRSLLNRSAAELSKTKEYRSLWKEIAEETRRYNLEHQDGPAVIVLTPFYRALDAKIGSIGFFDPDLTKLGPETLNIDRVKDGSNQQEWYLHAGINRAAALGKSTVPLTIISVLSLLLATLLAPRHRILVPVVTALLYALLCWGAASWFGGQSPESLGITSHSTAGTALITGIWNQLAPSLTEHLQAAASYGPVLAIIALLLGILIRLIALGRNPASDATAITH